MSTCVYVQLILWEEKGNGQIQFHAPFTALRGLVISARKHLDLDSKDDEVMDITSEAVAVKAYHTLHVLFNRWPLKSKKKVGVGRAGVG
jgi:hypothetical protein